jgi:hypothetical protein
MKAKSILACSLSFNAVALALGGVLLFHGPHRTARVEGAERKVAAARTADVVPVVKAAPVSEPRTLHWSDLASSDYETYARNLRAIGCPESTIREILTGAIARIYDGKRQGVTAQYQQGKIDKVTMETAVAQLWDEQNDAVNRLSLIVRGSAILTANKISPAMVTTAAENAPAGGGVPAGSVSPDPAIRVPVAFAEPDSSLALTDAQQAAMAQASNDFAKKMSASKLAPTDPAYHQLWQEAQDDADERLKVQLGETYLQLEQHNQKPH